MNQLWDGWYDLKEKAWLPSRFCLVWHVINFLSQTFSTDLLNRHRLHRQHHHNYLNHQKTRLNNASLCRYCYWSRRLQEEAWYGFHCPNMNRSRLVWHCCLLQLCYQCFSCLCPTVSQTWHPSTSIRYMQSEQTTSKMVGAIAIQSLTYGCQECAATIQNPPSFQIRCSNAAVLHCSSNLAKMTCLISWNLDFPISH